MKGEYHLNDEREKKRVDVMLRINGSEYLLLQATSRQAAVEFLALIPQNLIEAAQRAALIEMVRGCRWQLPELMAAEQVEEIRGQLAAKITDLEEFIQSLQP